MKKNIIIYLGSKCNLNCKYCHREKEDDIKLSEDFLRELSTFTGEIIFRGGEPTLYMDDIKTIVFTAKNASFSMTTNGKLLELYIDYFRKHNFSISISYDGNNLRRFDPYTKHINYPVTNTIVLTAGSDIFKILDKFDEKSLIVGSRLELYPHIAHYTNEYNEQYAMVEEDYIRISSQLKDCMKLFVKDFKKYHSINKRYYGIYKFFNNYYHNNFSFGETVCVNKSTRRVDVTGQDYNCLYIRDQKLDNNWIETQQNIIRSLSPKCEYCSVYDMCGGGCLKSIYHNKECVFYYDIFTWYKDFYKKYKSFLDCC